MINYVVYVIPKSLSHVGLLGCFDQKQRLKLGKALRKALRTPFSHVGKAWNLMSRAPRGVTHHQTKHSTSWWFQPL